MVLEDRPKVRYVVVVDYTYEPGVHGFVTREAAVEFYTRTSGAGEAVLLLEVLESK